MSEAPERVWLIFTNEDPTEADAFAEWTADLSEGRPEHEYVRADLVPAQPSQAQPGVTEAMLDHIESYGFECEAGNLRNCLDWKVLRAALSAREGEWDA